MTKKQYIQFSKRVVTAVVASAFLLCAASLALTARGLTMTPAADIIKTYADFAKVVFVAYSGNSAVEKWLTASHPPDPDAPSDNG